MKVEDEVKLYTTDKNMIRWTCGFTVNERKKSAKVKELLGLKAVSLAIWKSRLRKTGLVEHKVDTIGLKRV